MQGCGLYPRYVLYQARFEAVTVTFREIMHCTELYNYKVLFIYLMP